MKIAIQALEQGGFNSWGWTFAINPPATKLIEG